MTQPARSIRRDSPTSVAPLLSTVLIDGSALFLAVRSLYEGRQLDYRALIEVLVAKVQGLERPGSNSPTRWVMWTSASPQNQGQTKFLDFAEHDLKWEIRRFDPVSSYMVDPALSLGLTGDTRVASRLVRFDASIAFALGRLAERSRAIVVSDSFALADPMLLTHRITQTDTRPPVLAFFARALDTRWQGVLRREAAKIALIDLDEEEQGLFGQAPVRRPVHTASTDSYLF